MKINNKRFSEYNSIIKEYDKMYRDAIKTLGLNDSSFWILYTLRDDGGGGITQKEIVNRNFLPPQTINSELKRLEKDVVVELVSGIDKRTKKVYLTQKGIELTTKTADKMMAIERRAMDILSEQEQLDFLKIFRKYISYLRQLLDEMEKYDE